MKHLIELGRTEIDQILIEWASSNNMEVVREQTLKERIPNIKIYDGMNTPFDDIRIQIEVKT